MAGKSASLTFRLVLRASQPITMSKCFSGIFDFDFNLGMVAVLQKIGAFWYNN